MFTFIVFFAAFLLEGIGTYVSVVGLGHLFAYSTIVMIMAVALDVAKVANVTFLYRHWKEIGWTLKSYLLSATFVLMIITSTGVFGFLSGEFQKAIADTNQQTVMIQALTDEQGRLQKRKEEIDKQIAQLPQNNVRGRRQLIQQFGPEVQRLNSRLAEIDKQLPELKVASIGAETHVGPILYVAKAFNTTPEEAVKWIIFTIIGVFDPLAIALLIAGNFLLARNKKPAYEPDDGPLTDEQFEQIKEKASLFEPLTKVQHEKIAEAEPVAGPVVETLQEPPLEKVTIKPVAKRGRKVITTTEGDKEVIRLQEAPRRSMLEDVRVNPEPSSPGAVSATKGAYED